jgi:hypothetical protein
MNEYNFTQTLHPYGNNPEAGIVQIDPAAQYGYWERKDGSEGGGLWFAQDTQGELELIDYDGAAELPRAVVQALRAAGFMLDDSF